MNYKNPDELTSTVSEMREAASALRWQLARTIGVSQCYYLGAQNIGGGYIVSGPNSTTGRTLTRNNADTNPDSTRLRVVHNLVTKMIIKAAAATHPAKIEVEGTAPDFDPGIEATVKAQTLESLANISVDYSGFLQAAQDAQFNRVIAGVWGLGFFMKDSEREIDEQMVPDRCVKAFTFDPTRLILDTGEKSKDLLDHEVVVYEDVWTIDKVRRTFGAQIEMGSGESKPGKVYIEVDKMPRFGDLVAQEIEISNMSNGQLYQHYRTHSRSRATRVVQVHTKGSDGRFGRMDVLIQDSRGKLIAVNFDNPESPFGGSGLPLALIHAHPRPGSMWSIGEGQMTKDAQDQVNLAASLFWRQLQRHGGPKLLADLRNFPQGTTEEQLNNRFTNAVGGVFAYQARTEKGVPPPNYLETPAPQPFIMDAIDRAQQHMREQTSRVQESSGLGAKTHIPYATTDRLLEEADQVLGIRVQTDAAVYTQLIQTLVATNINLVKAENPGLLGFLRTKGFGQDEFMVCLETDEYELGTELKVRESSVRFRSLAARQQSLENALDKQAITPMGYRAELSEDDVPLTATDKRMFGAIRKRVDRLVRGEPWEPMALGEYNEQCLASLREAMFDRRVERDPAAKQRVREAVWLQMESAYREQAMKAEAEAAANPQPQAPQEQPAQGPMTLGDIVSQMEGASQQGVPAEPQAA